MIRIRSLTPTISIFSAALTMAIPISNAQERTRTLSEQSYLNPKSWFTPSACSSNSGDGLYLAIGPTTVKVALEIVRGIVPGNIVMTKGSDGKSAFQVPSKLGCREAPLSISAANLSADQNQHGPIIVSRSPEDRAALETQLAKIRDGGTCPT
jgi:hypothetical protein